MCKNDHMNYVYFNNNPLNKSVGDCVIRAISKAEDKSWRSIYNDLADYGYGMADMPSSNSVWGQYLMEHGYKRIIIPNTCPNCYTVRQFAEEHPRGTFILATGTHTVCVIDGTVYDSWNSLNEVVIYYFWRR